MLMTGSNSYLYATSFPNTHLQFFMNATGLSSPNQSVLTGLDAMFVDQRIDDGTPLGQVMGNSLSALPACWVLTAGKYSYIITGTNLICGLAFMVE